MQENEAFVNEEGALQPLAEEATLRVLQAAVKEARGRAGVYVTRDRVMQRANIVLCPLPPCTEVRRGAEQSEAR